MDINIILTYVCFSLWGICTFLVINLQVLKPQSMNGTMHPVKNIRHHLLMVAGYSWLAMWLFRFM